MALEFLLLRLTAFGVVFPLSLGRGGRRAEWALWLSGFTGGGVYGLGILGWGVRVRVWGVGFEGYCGMVRIS